MVDAENCISAGEARQLIVEHLNDASKVLHCEVVAHIMRGIALELGQDVALWEMVALCHDLDEERTTTDRSKHGLLTAEWLNGRLPLIALDAIRAHDHRTGYAGPLRSRRDCVSPMPSRLPISMQGAQTLLIWQMVKGRYSSNLY